MNVSIHILLKFATSKTGRNVIGGILLFIVTVLALLATLMACMASFVVAQFSDQFHPPMPHNTVISSSFTIGRKNPVTGEVENHYGTDFPAPEGTVIVASSAGTVQSKWSNSVPCATSTHTACCTEPALSPRPFVNLRHKVWHSC